MNKRVWSVGSVCRLQWVAPSGGSDPLDIDFDGKLCTITKQLNSAERVYLVKILGADRSQPILVYHHEMVLVDIENYGVEDDG